MYFDWAEGVVLVPALPRIYPSWRQAVGSHLEHCEGEWDNDDKPHLILFEVHGHFSIHHHHHLMLPSLSSLDNTHQALSLIPLEEYQYLHHHHWLGQLPACWPVLSLSSFSLDSTLTCCIYFIIIFAIIPFWIFVYNLFFSFSFFLVFHEQHWFYILEQCHM